MFSRIGVRLMAGFATLFMMMAAASGIALVASRGAQDRYESLVERQIPARDKATALAIIGEIQSLPLTAEDLADLQKLADLVHHYGVVTRNVATLATMGIRRNGRL